MPGAEEQPSTNKATRLGTLCQGNGVEDSHDDIRRGAKHMRVGPCPCNRAFMDGGGRHATLATFKLPDVHHARQPKTMLQLDG